VSYLSWDGLWCPCCGYRLRTRPRNLKYKAKLRARNKVEEESKILLSTQPVQKSSMTENNLQIIQQQ
jgi:hypothetical protein